jgi:hypothetical protein
VLDRLSAPLCDAVTGRRGSAAMLAAIERANLFLVPLDHERDWYRYHGLFRTMLADELERREPGRRRELQVRAAEWFVEATHSYARLFSRRASSIAPPSSSSGWRCRCSGPGGWARCASGSIGSTRRP